MNTINLPALSVCYFELKIFRIQFKSDAQPDIDNLLNVIHLIAPDSYVAVYTFSGIFPERDIINVTCVSDCISIFPTV